MKNHWFTVFLSYYSGCRRLVPIECWWKSRQIILFMFLFFFIAAAGAFFPANIVRKHDNYETHTCMCRHKLISEVFSQNFEKTNPTKTVLFLGANLRLFSPFKYRTVWAHFPGTPSGAQIYWDVAIYIYTYIYIYLIYKPMSRSGS